MARNPPKSEVPAKKTAFSSEVEQVEFRQMDLLL